MADHVFIRGEGGSVFKMDLPLHETIEDRLLKGYLTRVNEDGTPYIEGQDEVPGLPTERPALNAAKPIWVGWAVANGMTPDDAEALTKVDLIEKFGATAAPIVPAADGAPVEGETPAEPDKDAPAA